MIQEYIEVPNKKWGIVVVLDFDVDEDYDELIAQFQSFGMTSKNAKRALNILFNYNTGMAISNDDLRMSAIYISKATSLIIEAYPSKDDAIVLLTIISTIIQKTTDSSIITAIMPITTTSKERDETPVLLFTAFPK